MKTSLHGNNLLASKHAEDELTAVAFYGGDLEVRDDRIVHLVGDLDIADQVTQSGAENDAVFRGKAAGSLVEESCCFLHSFHESVHVAKVRNGWRSWQLAVSSWQM